MHPHQTAPITVFTAVPPVSVAVVIPVSARKELSRFTTGIAPQDSPRSSPNRTSTRSRGTPKAPHRWRSHLRLRSGHQDETDRNRGVQKMYCEHRSRPIPIALRSSPCSANCLQLDSLRCCSRSGSAYRPVTARHQDRAAQRLAKLSYRRPVGSKSTRLHRSRPTSVGSQTGSWVCRAGRRSVIRIWLVPVPAVKVLSASIAGTEPRWQRRSG